MIMVEAALELRIGQGLTMTPQLRQSIQLLQLSTIDLNRAIDEEMEKNPLLTREDEGFSDDPARTLESPSSDLPDPTTALDMEGEHLWGAEADDHAESWRDPASGHDLSSYDGQDHLVATRSLHEALMEQLRMSDLHGWELKAVEWMVDMLDAAGYLPHDSEARAALFGIDPTLHDKLVSYLQQCEPTGIAARSLKECLTLQLIERNLYSLPMRALLDHLDLVAQRSMKALCKVCGVELPELGQLIQLLKSCNPKPASGYDTSSITDCVVPELMVRAMKNGGWSVELNQEVLPKIALNTQYSNHLRAQIRDRSELKAINEHMMHANWLVKAIHQRNHTLLNVALAIIELQHDFFAYGIKYLKPMTLKDIATKISCHESTVSRITTQKYLMCDRGTFELKYFFNAHVHNSNGGEDYSNRSVMHLISTIIDAESHQKILSDDAITDMLNKRGIDVARRTVVKYRQQLGIPSSIERRKNKKKDVFCLEIL
ncbi:MAG: RNA polymerase sigma-54 factor [Alphaproteobacteria bacterium]|nr:MAG: RNA polymerase sigma-54 factor [Alphaproteobacteria bacterium]TAF41997.1 MAG: RNA polymerase sigma-54 factor [Alphaproteobacteria bacterium]TAF76605.1 MAG: RNA polymerase sigma-54 factor [Alphaproteobacteria bacterium]